MSEKLVEAVARNPAWYHTIELAPGVVTPGEIDLRKLAARVLPDRLDGLRALDVGTFDGFWAFELVFVVFVNVQSQSVIGQLTASGVVDASRYV